MATFEQLKLATQVQQVLANLRRDMRSNAQGYLDAVTAGKPLAGIASVATANTVQYQKILDWLQSANTDVALKAKVTSGLTALSLLFSDVVGYYTEMRTAANAEAAAETAGLTTGAAIQALANATLANVTAWDSLWPNG